MRVEGDRGERMVLSVYDGRKKRVGGEMKVDQREIEKKTAD